MRPRPDKDLRKRRVRRFAIAAAGGGPVLGSYYRRPGGVDRYLRPDGTSFYLRP